MTQDRADVCAVALADIYREDGEILANPTFGILPYVGARLARETFAPRLLITDDTDDVTLVADMLPVGRSHIDSGAAVEGQLLYRQVFHMIWAGRRHVVMGASQLDRWANQNISCIGDWKRPKTQLIGVRGAPGNTSNHAVSYWIPAHDRRVLVEEVDFVCGCGPKRAIAQGLGFNDIRAVVTNLCVMRVRRSDLTLQVSALHPGVSFAEVQAATGFELDESEPIETSRAPTDAELALIQYLDPDGKRYREVPTGPLTAK
jgi:acyl CoA:acetate/3-ketoacid CoA transferase beta subunit